MDFVGKDELFLELLDWPKTFPKVWGILSWHIQLYHSHLGITPPPPPDEKPEKKRLGWHQDSGRLNAELPVVFPVHPRTAKAIEQHIGGTKPDLMMMAPLGYLDFLRLLTDAQMVLTDSGGIQEEAGISPP